VTMLIYLFPRGRLIAKLYRHAAYRRAIREWRFHKTMPVG